MTVPCRESGAFAAQQGTAVSWMRRSAASLPLARITATAETGNHADDPGNDTKEQRVRKTAATSPADILVDDGELLWLCADPLNDCLNFCDEAVGRLHITRGVPIARFKQFSSRRRAEDDRRHAQRRCRSSALS